MYKLIIFTITVVALLVSCDTRSQQDQDKQEIQVPEEIIETVAAEAGAYKWEHQIDTLIPLVSIDVYRARINGKIIEIRYCPSAHADLLRIKEDDVIDRLKYAFKPRVVPGTVQTYTFQVKDEDDNVLHQWTYRELGPDFPAEYYVFKDGSDRSNVDFAVIKVLFHQIQGLVENR